MSSREKTLTTDLERFLLHTHTAAFLVIQDDTILYEGYISGYRRESICPSFSVAKSFAAALVGIAIDEGYIGSVEDPITKYLPELEDPRLSRVTIRHLLAMCSGFRWSLTNGPCSEEPRAYFSPDLRRFALHPKIAEKPGRHFNYNTSWSLDSEKSGFELMGTGLNARTWPEWQEFLASGVGFYGWLWWGYRREGGLDDFFAEGVLGQHIYVSPTGSEPYRLTLLQSQPWDRSASTAPGIRWRWDC